MSCACGGRLGLGPWGAFALAALVLTLASCGREEAPEEAGEVGPAAPSSVTESTEVDLYFPGESGRLERESRELPGAEDVDGRVRQLVEALLEGPDGGDLYPPLPDEISLASILVTPARIAYIDFETASSSAEPSFGSRGELLAVYSFVDTVLLNVEEVRAVVLLWNGHQRFSFAGHVDTASPLTANLSLIAAD